MNHTHRKGNEEKIERILNQMTIEEKVAQMQQLAEHAMPKDIFEKFKSEGNIGSYLFVMGDETNEFLDYTSKSRMKIPPIFGIDAIHGYALLKDATIFPSQLAMACTWDEKLVEKIAEVTADEVAADGLNWVFSPVLCLGRDLRWGRVNETFGEDAELCSRLGVAMVRGYQKSGKVAACAKHYLGYGEATGGRDSYDTEITERKAREIFLKPFKAVVDAGCMTIMTAYGSIDGEPLTMSHRYLTEILKEEYGFDGFVVTDWANIGALITEQKVCENIEEACVEGVVAGNDMSMTVHDFYHALIKAVKNGRISEEFIDNAVRRILRVKERLGLLDEQKKKEVSQGIIGCDLHQKVNYEAAIKSTVLLKNDGVLPLTGKRKIAVLGPNADDMRVQYGDWTYFTHPNQKKPCDTVKEGAYTILKGIKEIYPNCEISYAKGCSVENAEDTETSELWMQEATMIAAESDVAVIVLGDNLNQNGEMHDRANLALSGRQNELVKRVKELGKKVIVVLVNGKPLVLDEIEKYADAIVETFNGGDMCGLAVAKLLRGIENFSGKLPISFPYHSAALPCYYNQYEYWHGKKYIDVPVGGLYPFGFGLSYSKFVYGELTLDKTVVKRGEKTSLCVEIENESEVDGEETVQLYFKDKVCKILTPIRTLLDFKKVIIRSGAKEKVVFEIDTEKLGYYDRECKYNVDGGEFIFYVSGDGKNFKEITLSIEE